MTYGSSSAASDVSLAPFGLRIIRAMQPSAARGRQPSAWRSIAAPAGAGTAEAIVPAIEPDDCYLRIARREATDIAASRCREVVA